MADSVEGRVMFDGINRVRFRVDDREATVLCLWWGDPRYVLEFLQDQQQVGSGGATGSLTAAVRAVEVWVISGSIEELHRRASFLDQPARIFDAVRNEAIRVGLGQPLELPGSERALVFEQGGRSCRILSAGMDGNLDVALHEDGVKLFAPDTRDFRALCGMVRAWLIEAESPKVMRARFEQLQPGSLEDWRVLQDFTISWDFLVRAFVEPNNPKRRRTLELIAQLRAHGFDQTLRAGSSLSAVVLSRARNHDLVHDQPCVQLDVEEDAILMTVNSISWDAPHQRLPTHDLAELPSEIIDALHQLEHQPID